jgi:outer membrane protein
LREITGRYHKDLMKLGEDMPLVLPEPQDLKVWTDTAMTENPTLKSTQEVTEQVRETINTQRSGYYPTLDLVLNRTDSISDTPIQDYESTTAQVQLSMSIYEGGRTDSGVTQAMELYNQNQELLEQQKRATQRQVRNAYRGVVSGTSRVKALKQALISNESALRAAEAGYEVGTRTTVDVLVARTNLFLAQRNYAQSRYDYLLNILRLKQAAGNLGITDLERIAGWLH